LIREKRFQALHTWYGEKNRGLRVEDVSLLLFAGAGWGGETRFLESFCRGERDKGSSFFSAGRKREEYGLIISSEVGPRRGVLGFRGSEFEEGGVVEGGILTSI